MGIAVTGAFGYSGRYIAKRLLDAGHSVITLTNSLQRKNPFGNAVVAHPFHFDEPTKLTESLRGVDTLINTYWVRFDHRLFTHDQAVANTKVMFNVARDAGVRRIVHVSITKPDINSDLPYFRGKAELEQALMELGLSYCILRPTVLFGKEDVLINNIAWALRHLPVFGVFGSGNYKLQPGRRAMGTNVVPSLLMAMDASGSGLLVPFVGLGQRLGFRYQLPMHLAWSEAGLLQLSIAHLDEPTRCEAVRVLFQSSVEERLHGNPSDQRRQQNLANAMFTCEDCFLEFLSGALTNAEPDTREQAASLVGFRNTPTNFVGLLAERLSDPVSGVR